MNDSTGSLSSCDMALDEQDTITHSSPDRRRSHYVSSSFIDELKPGDSFVITGTLIHTCESFSINFIVNNSAKDIAFHFNPRLPQNYVVRNSKINHQWCKEEVITPFNLELERGQRVTVQFVLTEHCFQIAVNGKHFGAYEHRLPYKRIKILETHGDIKDINVNQTTVRKYPEILHDEIPIVPAEALSERVGTKFSDSNTIAVPFNGALPIKLMHGVTLHIIGCIKLLPHSFYINLQQGSYIWPHPDVLLHFNPRFTGGMHVICYNSWLKSKWGTEQRTASKAQFMPGRQFHLRIQSVENKYDILLNNELILEYQARENKGLVDTVYIQGDIKLYDVFVEKW